ncbi:MAG: integration host factor subunit beta [Bacteroidetes bacterium]|nr:integration host factor subunit beta [Bacteroidota bacterium]
MNKSECIEAVATKTGISAREAQQAVETILESMADALIKGDRVEIRGFGCFTVKDYDSYTGRNPKTGEKIVIQSKKLPVFKVGQYLAKLVNGKS